MNAGALAQIKRRPSAESARSLPDEFLAAFPADNTGRSNPPFTRYLRAENKLVRVG